MSLPDAVRNRHRPDYSLSVLVIILVGIGMIVLYSTGSVINYNITGGASDKNGFFQTQMLSFALGIIGWFLASRFHYQRWRKYAPWLFYISIVLMLLVVTPWFSLRVNGATRWLKLGIFSFQPVELFKLSVVLYLSAWLEKNRQNLNRFTTGLVPYILLLGLIAGLIVVIQKDLGSAIVVIGIAMSIYFVSGVPVWLYGTSLGVLGAALAASVALFPYRLARVLSFFNHNQDTSGAAYHINQALIALGSGGLIGRGLGNSYQVYGYLPEATNDSIFALIGEQFGFIGTFTLMLLFSIVVYRGYKISRHSPDSFGRSVAIGITVWIGLQAAINVAAMLNLVPLTGIPLPFISYGGTSLLFSLIAMGILQNISRYTTYEVNYANYRGRRGDRRTYHADPSNSRRVKRPA